MFTFGVFFIKVSSVYSTVYSFVSGLLRLNPSKANYLAVLETEDICCSDAESVTDVLHLLHPSFRSVIQHLLTSLFIHSGILAGIY